MNRIGLKPDVKLTGRHLDPEIYKMVFAAYMTAPKLNDGTVWITSANDGTHKVGSKHYKSEAFDIRIWNVRGYDGPHREMGKLTWTKQEVITNWARGLRLALGDDYDVVYGDRLHLDHIHVEWDPASCGG